MRSTLGALLLLVGLLLVAWAGVMLLQRGPRSPIVAPPQADVAARAGEPPRLATPPSEVHEARPAASRAEPDERHEVDVDGIVGFVLALEDGSPVPDAWIELMGPPRAGGPPEDPRVLAEAGSDSAGRFVLPWPEEPGSWVRVRAPYGWARTEPWWLLAPADRGAAPLELRLRERRRAPLEIALRDIRTGESVPHFLVRVDDPVHGTRVDIPTDEHGRGVSEIALMEGPWRLTLLDDQRMEDSARTLLERLGFEALPTGELHEFEIPVGPTWLLDLRGVGDLDLEVLGAFLSGESGDYQPPWAGDQSRVPVRTELHGGWPWVRFPEVTVGSLLGEDRPLHLVVVDRAGSLRGEARVDPTWGVHPEPIHIELRRTGALTVEVRDRSSRALESARLSLRALPEGLEQRARTDPDGTARFQGLPEGEYLLRVGHNVADPIEVRVHVDGGRRTTRRVVLAAASPAGDVEGRVIGGSMLRALPPGLAAHFKVLLVSLDGAGRNLSVDLAFEERGDELVAPFRFEDVPAGEYVLRLSGFKSGRWWPDELFVRPPVWGLELRELPHDALLDLELRAVGSIDGEPLEGAWLWLESEALPPPASGMHGGHERIEVPRGTAFSWGLGAAGRVPRFGNEGDLREEDGRLGATIALERGHGLRLDVVDAAGGAVSGARVVVDGAEVGTTDDAGRYLLLLDTMPASVELRQGASRTSAGVLDALEQGQPVCEVRLGGG